MQRRRFGGIEPRGQHVAISARVRGGEGPLVAEGGIETRPVDPHGVHQIVHRGRLVALTPDSCMAFAELRPDRRLCYAPWRLVTVPGFWNIPSCQHVNAVGAASALISELRFTRHITSLEGTPASGQSAWAATPSMDCVAPFPGRLAMTRCIIMEQSYQQALSVLRQTSQHILQDFAVAKIIDFVLRLDAAKNRHVFRLSILPVDHQRQRHARLDAAR